MSATDFATRTAANTTSTIRMTSPATAPSMACYLLVSDVFVDRRDGAADLDHGHLITGFVHIVGIQRSRRPHFAVESDLAAVAGHPVQDQRLLTQIGRAHV